MCNLQSPATPVGATAVPLIWTSKGNMPVDKLRYIPLWTITEAAVQFVEEYYDGDELVRRNVHMNLRS